MGRLQSPVHLDGGNPEFCSLEYRLKIIGRLPFFKHLPVETIYTINALLHDREDTGRSTWRQCFDSTAVFAAGFGGDGGRDNRDSQPSAEPFC
jgi:hypothetical protein